MVSQVMAWAVSAASSRISIAVAFDQSTMVATPKSSGAGWATDRGAIRPSPHWRCT